MNRLVLLISLLCLVSALGFGQVTTSTAVYTHGFSGTATFPPPQPFGMTAVTGAPYSGEEVSETVRTLADGTHITQKMPGRKVWRDADGRTRVERPLFMGMGINASVEQSPIVVEITDPVAGYKYTLDMQNKIAHRQVLPADPS